MIQPGQQLIRNNNQLRSRVLHHKPQTLIRIVGIQRLIGAAGFHYPKRSNDHILGTGNEHRHRMAPSQSLPGKVKGNFVRDGVHLCIGIGADITHLCLVLGNGSGINHLIQLHPGSDAREIARLKKELATVREVLRSYIRQVDSLNQVNERLVAENDRVKDQLQRTSLENAGLQHEKETLTEKVAIAAQLDASGIQLTALNKRNKVAKKVKDAKTLQVSFTIARNVTATNGNRTFYVRIQTPTGQVLGEGTFTYENRQLEYSIKKVAEYTGEELTLQTYWTGENTLIAGDYRVSIFAEGNMIGTRTFTLN